MPENYYCLDNFFKKMTDLESPRKNNDCYFYYYSTCTKGDNCTFRHEPSALGCETTCSFWKEGKCINVHCNFRHMELRKNRKTIPCYWESQPSGCKKPYCPFKHVNKKAEKSDEELVQDDTHDLPEISNKSDDFTAPVVDPLVVNFEEESDNESSTPTQSSQNASTHRAIRQQCARHPMRPPTYEGRLVEVKTLEEIKLDRIQAESAAYYSYAELPEKAEDATATRGRNVFKRLSSGPSAEMPEKANAVDMAKVQVLSLAEIRKRKRNDEETHARKVAKVDEIKVKTLGEIRAERKKRQREGESEANEKRVSEEEVSSTSKFDENSLQQVGECAPKVKCVVAPVQRVDSVGSDLVAENEKKEEIRGDAEQEERLEKKAREGNETSLEDIDKLLDGDDEETSSMSLKAEDDILNDIDDMLSE